MTTLAADHAGRLERARTALEGLSVGDAFGQRFFFPFMREYSLTTKRPPEPPWYFTDDTEMALAIVEVLDQQQTIDQDALARRFAERFAADPARGYGAGARQLLRELCGGADWRTSARGLFGGEGSLGNGGAMRAAPLGAYFADDVAAVVREATLSAEVTHAHPEGQAGAIAVAVAAAWCCRNAGAGPDRGTELLETARDATPPGETRTGIEMALTIPLDHWEHGAANVLGNGRRVTAPDTVPFCLWCAAAHLDSYTGALWAAMHVEGDVDTNCAIIGGIVACAVGRAGIPPSWLHSREPLPPLWR